jgi:hypothetical protein
VSDAPDPLERELAALRPPAVSPELRRRVAERLSGGGDPSARSVSDGGSLGRRLRSWLVVLGLLGLTGVLAVMIPRKKEPPAPEPPAVVPAPPTDIESPDPAPSVLAYHQALARSPDELTALLDKHAAPGPDPVPVAAFTRSTATLDP